jgi:hypothetical protein
MVERKIYDSMQIENEIAKKNNTMEVSKKMGKMSDRSQNSFFLTPRPIFVHTSSPFFLFSFSYFFNPKNHLYKRNYIETPDTPELPRECRESVRQFTGAK